MPEQLISTWKAGAEGISRPPVNRRRPSSDCRLKLAAW